MPSEAVAEKFSVTAKNELSSPEVLSKQDAAVEWCEIATDYNADIGKKPWIYLLIPHDEVKDNMTLISFRRLK
ncbi:hypothetical protein LQZ19_09490 [Treponema primitia]|uniref:hypothetical protein n=1 Tax=Treponema primitia TaxID=88058 RepID=UPI00397F2756